MSGPDILQVKTADQEAKTILANKDSAGLVVEDLLVDTQDTDILNKLFQKYENGKEEFSRREKREIVSNIDTQLEGGKLKDFVGEIIVGIFLYIESNYESFKDSRDPALIKPFIDLVQNLEQYYDFEKIKVSKEDPYKLTKFNITVFANYDEVIKALQGLHTDANKKQKEDLQKQTEAKNKQEIIDNKFNATKNFLETINTVDKNSAIQLFEENKTAFQGLFDGGFAKLDPNLQEKVKNLIQEYFDKKITINTTDIYCAVTQENDPLYVAGEYIIKVGGTQTAEIVFGKGTDLIHTMRNKKYLQINNTKENQTKLQERKGTPNELIQNLSPQGCYHAFESFIKIQNNPAEKFKTLLTQGLLQSNEAIYPQSDDSAQNEARIGYKNTIAKLVAKYASQDTSILQTYVTQVKENLSYLGEESSHRVQNYNNYIGKFLDAQPRTQTYKTLSKDGITAQEKTTILQSLNSYPNANELFELMDTAYGIRNQLIGNIETENPIDTKNTIDGTIDSLRKKYGGAIVGLMDLFGGKGSFMERIDSTFGSKGAEIMKKKLKETLKMTSDEEKKYTKLKDELDTKFANKSTTEIEPSKIINEYAKNQTELQAFVTDNFNNIDPTLIQKTIQQINKSNPNTINVNQILHFQGKKVTIKQNPDNTAMQKITSYLTIDKSTRTAIQQAENKMRSLQKYQATIVDKKTGTKQTVERNYSGGGNKSINSFNDVSAYFTAYLISGSKDLINTVDNTDIVQTSTKIERNTDTPKTLANISADLQKDNTPEQTQAIQDLANKFKDNSTGYPELVKEIQEGDKNKLFEFLQKKPSFMAQILEKTGIGAYTTNLIPYLKKTSTTNFSIEAKKPAGQTEHKLAIKNPANNSYWFL